MHIDILVLLFFTFLILPTITIVEIFKIINNLEKENFTKSLQNKD